MKQGRQEKRLLQLYRDGLNAEIRSPQTQREKRNFIKLYFQEAPLTPSRIFGFASGMALASLVVFVLVFYQQPEPLEVTTPKAPQSAPLAPQSVPVIATEKPKEIQGPSVEIKSLTSGVGPTMVYQKMYNHTPMTIIWVFPEKEAA
jgi:hypothetical protein